MAGRKRKPDSLELAVSTPGYFISYDTPETQPRQSSRLVEKAGRPPPPAPSPSAKKARNSRSAAVIPAGLELPLNEMAPQTPARRPRVPTIPKARPKPTPRRKVCFNDLKQNDYSNLYRSLNSHPVHCLSIPPPRRLIPRHMSITILLPRLPHSLITMFMPVLVCFPMNRTPIRLMNPTLTLQIWFQPIHPLLFMLDQTLLYLPPTTPLRLTCLRFLAAQIRHLLPNLVVL